MSDFRIINRRDESDDCEDGCSSCSSFGGCSSRVIPQPTAQDDEEMLFKPGTMVISKLTGDRLMVLKAEPDNPVSYVCRTPKYEMVRIFDFELEAESKV